jgi:hypothetical protein
MLIFWWTYEDNHLRFFTLLFLLMNNSESDSMLNWCDRIQDELDPVRLASMLQEESEERIAEEMNRIGRLVLTVTTHINTLVADWKEDSQRIFYESMTGERGYRIAASEFVEMLSALRPDKAWQLREELHTAIGIELDLEEKNRILQSRLRHIITSDGECTDAQYNELFNCAGFKFVMGEYKRIFQLEKIQALPGVEMLLSRELPLYKGKNHYEE